MSRLFAAVLLLVLALAAPALAHTRSESHTVWEIGSGRVDVVVAFATTESDRLAALGRARTDEELKAYLAGHIYPLADGRPCELAPPVETLTAAPGFRKFDLTFRCAEARKLQVRSTAFLEGAPAHLDFAQVQDMRSGQMTEQLLTRDRPEADVAGPGGELQDARFLDFIRMGVMHIFTGVDHMSFLLGLVLISRRLKDLVFVVTGFTIGHSLTLALAVTGVLRPHAEYIDALVALTIALIGAENVAVATGRPLPVALAAAALLLGMAALRMAGIGSLPALLLVGSALFTANYLMISGRLPDAGRLRMLITVVFGLIHGFGFAANLLEMQLPQGRIAELLIGFNLGVEIGQMTLVLGVSLGAWLLARARLAPPRAAVVELASAFLVGLGAYWFALRSF